VASAVSGANEHAITVATAPPPIPPDPRTEPPAASGSLSGSFPPAKVSPPEAATAEPNDGVWQALADGTRDGRPAMARTRLHNHRIRRDKYIDVIAFDRELVELVLVAGKDDPPSASIPSEKRTGLVPAADWDALLAVHNGGFLQKHGKWGFMLDGDIYTPARDDACTIVHGKDGSLRIATWSALGGAPDVRWWRQTPPCLVEGGVVNPTLVREGGTVLWGKAIGGASDIRRSAMALDQSGRTLFYVFSEWNTAAELADALKALGVWNAAELDVNWSYTKFFLFDHPPGAAPRIRETIVPKLEFDKRRYTERAAERDFFYLRSRKR
jgi:hypothetical protein